MQIKLNSPLDMHLHLRDEKMLEVVGPLTAKTFSWAVIMPNLVPPVKNLEDVKNYKNRILKACEWEEFNPFMTVFFHEGLTRENLEDLQNEILSIKLYPAWITTNSEGWAKDLLSEKSKKIFKNMEDLSIILNIHWETNDFVMDREKNFIPFYEAIAQKFPKLKIVMEHITTKESADLVQQYDNLYATITLHHLYITLDDVAGWMLEPHLFCKPIAKRPEDRDALLELALSWNSKVMFGSDSAPHPQSAKECSHCSAWIFTSPIALQLLVQLFEKNNSLKNLENFLTNNAVQIYNLEEKNLLIKKEIVLEKKDFIVPEKYNDVVPFMNGQKIERSLV
jgi:dihydroorotase